MRKSFHCEAVRLTEWIGCSPFTQSMAGLTPQWRHMYDRVFRPNGSRNPHSLGSEKEKKVVSERRSLLLPAAVASALSNRQNLYTTTLTEVMCLVSYAGTGLMTKHVGTQTVHFHFEVSSVVYCIVGWIFFWISPRYQEFRCNFGMFLVPSLN